MPECHQQCWQVCGHPHTSDHSACCCSYYQSHAQMCTERVDGTKLYEALATGQHPKLLHDHVLLHEAAAIPDSAVSDLAASGALWDMLVENEPDMLRHKVLAADLLLKAELPLVDSLRTLMIDQGFEPCAHISQAVAKYRYQRRQMIEGDRIALRECLDTLCAAYDITLEQLYEFETLAHWARERSSCFHPLGRNASQLDAAAVAAARPLITDSPEFAEVRASSLLLLGILEARLSEA